MAKKKKEETEKTTDELVIDVNSYDWEGKKLTRRAKLFIIYLTLPFQPCFEDTTKAALKAGYAKLTAYHAEQAICCNENVTYFINKFREQVQKKSIEAAYNDIIQQKIKRYTYNVQDFYETMVTENENTGAKKVITSLRPLDELTREQAQIVNNVQINQSGIATYDLPNKDKMMDDIIKLRNSFKEAENPDNSDVDVETTMKIIHDNLQIALNISKKTEKTNDFIENSDNLPEFDD